MNTWIRRSLNTGVLTAGALIAAGISAPAHADTTALSTDNNGILNGNQVYAPIQLPVNVCGDAVAVLGSATAGCEGGSIAALNPEWGYDHYRTTMLSKGNNGILNGNQVYAPIQAPINVCGVAVGIVGSAKAGCDGGASAHQGSVHNGGRHCKPVKPAKVAGYNKDHKQKNCGHDKYRNEVTMLTTGNNGIGNGNQAFTPVQVPVDVCGTAVGVIGSAVAGCTGGASAHL
ncbi:MAG TPA: chaplin family protein [Micromonosporaceae bacterium]|nr:chaplin family protein [Micromonosporaceae bacterium]